MKTFWYALIIGAVLVLGFTARCPEAQAEGITYTQAEADNLNAELTERYGALTRSLKTAPEAPPELRMLEHADLERLAGVKSGALKGFYTNGTIYLDSSVDLRTPMGLSIALHEMVHHFQFAKFGPAKDCTEWQQRELLAYAIQSRFLSAQSIAFQPPQIPTCI